MTGAVRPSRTVRLAAVATAAVLAGLLPGTNSAATEGDGELTLAYACRFASGEQDVAVRFSQAYPEAAVRGRPIQPGDLTARITIPRAGVTAMLPARAAALTGTGTLTAHVVQGASKADAHWPDLQAPSTPVGGTDDLVLVLGGEVPALTVTAPGAVTFTAGDLDLTLRPTAAGTASPTPSAPAGTSAPATPAPPAAGGTSLAGTTSSGTPGAGTSATAPGAATSAATSVPAATAAPLPEIKGTCSPKPGQDAVLARVPVPAAGAAGPKDGRSAPATRSGPSALPRSPSPDAPAGTPDKQGATRNSIELAPALHSGTYTCERTHVPGEIDQSALPEAPEGTNFYPGPDDPPLPDDATCAYAVGFSNVLKLKGAMVVNDPHGHPGLTTVQTVRSGYKQPDENNQGLYYELDSRGWMDLPPSEATFLTFGFAPTSAKMYFVPDGALTIVATGYGDTGDAGPASQPVVTTITGKMDIRLRDVKVNGVPLDVGTGCHTEQPVKLRLSGRLDDFMPGGGDGKAEYRLDMGGQLRQDDLTIPPFTGCAANGENLDPLFTASVSGPGNSLNLIQGVLCYPSAQLACNSDPASLVEIDLPELPHH